MNDQVQAEFPALKNRPINLHEIRDIILWASNNGCYFAERARAHYTALTGVRFIYSDEHNEWGFEGSEFRDPVLLLRKAVNALRCLNIDTIDYHNDEYDLIRDCRFYSLAREVLTAAGDIPVSNDGAPVAPWAIPPEAEGASPSPVNPDCGATDEQRSHKPPAEGAIPSPATTLVGDDDAAMSEADGKNSRPETGGDSDLYSQVDFLIVQFAESLPGAIRPQVKRAAMIGCYIGAAYCAEQIGGEAAVHSEKFLRVVRELTQVSGSMGCDSEYLTAGGRS